MLEFSRDDAIDGLSVRFDMAGLARLLEVLHDAMDRGERTIGGGGGPAAFDSVTFTFARTRDDGPRPAPARPRMTEPAD